MEVFWVGGGFLSSSLSKSFFARSSCCFSFPSISLGCTGRLFKYCPLWRFLVEDGLTSSSTGHFLVEDGLALSSTEDHWATLGDGGVFFGLTEDMAAGLWQGDNPTYVRILLWI
jgi:hypothetical protein